MPGSSDAEAAAAAAAAAGQHRVSLDTEAGRVSGGVAEVAEDGAASDMALLDAWWRGQRGRQAAYWQEIHGRMEKYTVARARVEEEILRRWAWGGPEGWHAPHTLQLAQL